MAADYMCGDGYEVATVGNICGDGCRPSRIVKDMSRPPTLLFWNGMLIQFFHLYEVGWFVSGVHIQFFHLYEVATVGNICEDGRRPSRIVEQDVNG